MTVGGLRLTTRSDHQPDSSLMKLPVDSAMPSTSPIVAVPAPSTLARNSGTRLLTISLDTSVRKLAAVMSQMLGGRRFIVGLG